MRRILLTGVLFVGAFIALGGQGRAQISEGGIPPSFSRSLKSSIPVVVMERVDVANMVAKEQAEDGKDVPFRFGWPFDVSLNPENSGIWENLPDGGRIWRLKVKSEGAYSINLLYDVFRLPAGAEFFLYSEDHQMIIGAFTHRNNKDHGRFATSPIKGDAVILEYYEPEAVSGPGEIEISRVVHAYKDIFNFEVTKDIMDFGDSGPCNNNVNCPEGEPWAKEKRAIAMILTSGGYRLCSGALVNNVQEDQTPYFLTANHCGGGEESWIFMFNYESPTCDDIEGPLNYTLSGAVKRANYATSDFYLVEISEAPPDSYNVYYAGWSNEDVASQSSTAIHHPSGDIKKISFDYDSVTSAHYLTYSGDSHWRIGQWEDGTTEGGSSGSPLFDQNHRIVGQLHGGYASCTNISSDWYGKFAMSWEGGGTSDSRLRDWLDPDGSGITVLDGFDPFEGVNILHTPLANTMDTVNDYDVLCRITSPAPLIPDSLLVFYEIDAAWYNNLLLPAGNEDEYASLIPTQSPPMTIRYYIFAMDIEGRTDVTDTLSFTVEESPIIGVRPESFSYALATGDSAWGNLIIENTGRGDLEYFLSVEFASEFKGVAEGLKDGGGPDNLGYYWTDSDEPDGPDFNWYDISSAGIDITGTLLDDNYSGPYDIGFNFPFYGDLYNLIYIGSNGLLGFDSTNLDSRFDKSIPWPEPPDNFLAWLWDDLDPTDPNNPGRRVYFLTDGRQCIIQFSNYPEYSAAPGDVITAQVILEKGGNIKYHYLNIAPGFDIGSGSIGLENSLGGDGLQVAYTTPYLHDSLTIGFYSPANWLLVEKTAGILAQNQADTIRCRFLTDNLDTGIYYAGIFITGNDPDPADNPWIIPVELTISGGSAYTCGDINHDEIINILDISNLLRYLYKGGPPPEPLNIADVNSDAIINVLDATYMINFLYKAGPDLDCP